MESGWGLHRGHFDQPRFHRGKFVVFGVLVEYGLGFHLGKSSIFWFWGMYGAGWPILDFIEAVEYGLGSQNCFLGPHFLEVLTPIWGNPFRRNAS